MVRIVSRMDHKEYRLACVMFTDIVGFSQMMETDEEGTLVLLDYHNKLIESHTKQHKGTVIKTIGDAYLVDFNSTVNAVKCAISIQNTLRDYNRELGNKALVLRIGVHLGDIYFYENDALGEGINIASRLQSTCTPGKICISQDVYNLVANKIPDLQIREVGDVKLKNISREIHVWEIQTEGTGKTLQIESDAAKQHTRATSDAGMTDSSVPGGQEYILAADGSVDVQRLKSKIIGQIKKLGKRLSSDQVRAWFGAKPPRGLDEALDALAERGFISKTGSGAGSTSGMSGGTGMDSAGRSSFNFEFGSGGRRQAGSSGSSSSNDWGWSELKEATKEIGRELRDAFRQSRWFGETDPNAPVPLPTARSTGEREGVDKRHERQWDRVLSARAVQAENDAEVVEVYRKQTGRSFKQMLHSFRQHLGSYIFVNAMLVLIWALTGSAHPWPLYVLGGWGIGLVSHLGVVGRRKRENDDLQALPLQNRRQLKLLRKLHKLRESHFGGLVAGLAVVPFLFLVNLITSSFPWALIAGGAISFSMFASLPAFKSKEFALLEDLNAEGVPTALLTSRKSNKLIASGIAAQATSSGPLHTEALRLQSVILEQLRTFGDEKPLGEDFPPLLNDYVKQVGDLEQRSREITSIVAEFPKQSLQNDIENLKKQADQAGSAALKKEYSKSIKQIEKQLATYEDLGSQQKLIELRLGNSMNALRQIQIELVRMKSFGKDKASEAAMRDLKEKSEQLSSFAEDMRSGYGLLESSEFAELEKYREQQD